MKPKCFKCEKKIDVAIDDDPWNAPSKAVVFEGGWNFGSTIYDVLSDGICVELIVCDECLKQHKELIQERKTEANFSDLGITRKKMRQEGGK